jgi:hypothetical protein
MKDIIQYTTQRTYCTTSSDPPRPVQIVGLHQTPRKQSGTLRPNNEKREPLLLLEHLIGLTHSTSQIHVVNP